LARAFVLLLPLASLSRKVLSSSVCLEESDDASSLHEGATSLILFPCIRFGSQASLSSQFAFILLSKAHGGEPSPRRTAASNKIVESKGESQNVKGISGASPRTQGSGQTHGTLGSSLFGGGPPPPLRRLPSPPNCIVVVVFAPLEYLPCWSWRGQDEEEDEGTRPDDVGCAARDGRPSGPRKKAPTGLQMRDSENESDSALDAAVIPLYPTVKADPTWIPLP